jgi:hypothetical protein
MLNSNQSPFLDDEEDEGGGLVFTKASNNDEDFDLNENVDTEISGPIFVAPQANGFLSQADEEDEGSEDAEETLDEEEDVELEGDENDSEEDLEEDELDEESTLAKNLADEENFEEEEDDSGTSETVVSKAKIILARKFLNNIQENIEQLSALLGGLLDDGDEERIGLAAIEENFSDEDEGGGRIVEGVFNGENMIGPDGHEYTVPANYASKSKLVEGDMLKLTITGNGIFRYKQTKPVDRERIIGRLEKDQNGNYFVNADKKKFRVITASITYYKGLPGDKVVILVPTSSDSAWAAVENVIKSK